MGVWNPGPAGTAGDDTFTGDATNETANGLAGTDTLNGNDGADHLRGGLGNDTVNGGAGNDYIELWQEDDSLNGIDSFDGGSGSDALVVYGDQNYVYISVTVTSIERVYFGDSSYTFNNVTLGQSQFGAGFANNLIVRGSSGSVADSLLISVDTNFNASGFVFSNWGSNDRLSLSGDADANTLRGSNTSDDLYGNAGSDTLYGGEGNDALYAGPGGSADGAVDRMYGGLGNDGYGVFEAGDQVIENVGEGHDRVAAWINYTLAANVEDMSLYGTATVGAGNDLNNGLSAENLAATLNGQGGSDILYGSAFDDVLIGGAGADLMSGRVGSDTYYVDNALDEIVEYAGQGSDRVYSVISFTLPDEVERLYLNGAGLRGTGNGLNNFLTGNAGANVLDGLAGADIMTGRGGDDTYFVDNAGDTTVENVGEGTDRVNASISWTLGANVDRLALSGTANNNATGNELRNIIWGNSGHNIIDGGGSYDKMLGGAGNDKYFVNDMDDETVENLNEGIDRVYATVSWSLSVNVEQLTLNGSGMISGTGNDLDNVIIGNSAANTLNGAVGADTLTGGGGADSFVFNSPLTSIDTIVDFNVVDAIKLEDTVFTAIGPVGTLESEAFHTGAAAHDGDDRIIYNSATGALYYDADGDGAGAQIQFAQLTGAPALSVADIIVI